MVDGSSAAAGLVVLGTPSLDLVLVERHSGATRGIQPAEEAELLKQAQQILAEEPDALLLPGGSEANFAAAWARATWEAGALPKGALIGRPHRPGVGIAGCPDPTADLRRLGLEIAEQEGPPLRAPAICQLDRDGETRSIRYPAPARAPVQVDSTEGVAGLLSRVAAAHLSDDVGTAFVQVDDHLAADEVSRLLGHLRTRVRDGLVAFMQADLLDQLSAVADVAMVLVGTRGRSPVTVVTGRDRRELPVPPLQDVVSDLGAGDAYAGGFSAAWLGGAGVEDAHASGCAQAAQALGVWGARPAGEVDPPVARVIAEVTERDPGRGPWPAIGDSLSRGVAPHVLSGGQTGVDTDGLVLADELGWPTTAVLPSGGRRERDAREVIPTETAILELPSPSYRFRTWVNVLYGDVTLLLDVADSEGSVETRRACHALGRPCVDAGGRTARDVARELAAHEPRVINVAGTRASRIADRTATREHLADVLLAYGVMSMSEPQGDGVRSRLDAAISAEHGSTGRLRVGVSDRGVPQRLVDAMFGDLATELTGRCVVAEDADHLLARLRPTDARDALLADEVDVTLAVDDVYVGTDLATEHMVTRFSPVGFGPAMTRATLLDGPSGMVTQHPDVMDRVLRSELPRKVVAGKAEAWVRLRPGSAVFDSVTTGRTARRNGLDVQRVDAVYTLTVRWRKEMAGRPAALLRQALDRLEEVCG